MEKKFSIKFRFKGEMKPQSELYCADVNPGVSNKELKDSLCNNLKRNLKRRGDDRELEFIDIESVL